MPTLRGFIVAAAIALALVAVAGGAATAQPNFIGPCDGGGDCQTNLNPNTTGCWHSGRVIHTGPIKNVDMNNPSVDYTTTIGHIEVWYSDYCQTNWIKTILDDKNAKSTISEWISVPPGPGGKYINTDTQVDTAPTAFSLQVYAPGQPVQWSVEVYQNKFLVGKGYGDCNDVSCDDF